MAPARVQLSLIAGTFGPGSNRIVNRSSDLARPSRCRPICLFGFLDTNIGELIAIPSSRFVIYDE